MAFDDSLIGSNDFDAGAATEDLIRRTAGQPLPAVLEPRMLNTRLARKLGEVAPEPEEVKAPKGASKHLDFSEQAVPAETNPTDAKADFSSQAADPSAPAAAPVPQPGIGITGNIVAGLKGIPAGAAQSIGGIVKGAGALAHEAQRETTPEMERALASGPPIEDAAWAEMKAKGFVERPLAPLQQEPLVKAGQAIQDIAPTMSPAEKASAGGTIGTMAGAIAPYALGTLVAGPLAGLTGSAAAMATDAYGSVYEEASKAGKPDEEAQKTAGKAALAAGVLGSLPLGAGKYAKSLIGKVAASGAAFATLGEAQEAILEQIKKDYDPKAGYTPEAKRIIAELVLGGAMGGLHHAFEGQQPQQGAQGQPGSPAAQLPPGGGPQPSAPGSGPQGGGSNTNARGKPNPSGWPGGTGSWSAPPGGGAGPQGAPHPGAGPQPGPGSAGPQAGPAPGKPPPGTGQGKAEGFTMDPRMRAKMEKVYGMYEPGADVSSMSDHELYNAVNEHLRDTSSTGYTTKPETAEEAAQRADTAKRREEDDILRSAGWVDAHLNAMSDEQRGNYLDEIMRRRESKPPETEGSGTREEPIRPTSADDVIKAQAAEPTQAQAQAENYRHAHMELPQFGLTGDHSISIETGVGQTRKGVDANGKPWEVTLTHAAYGRIKGTVGADGDHLDIFVGPHPTSPYIFVVDQHHPHADFDEHKILAGYRTPIDALHAYAHSYTDHGAGRIGHVTAMDPDEFKTWLKGDTTKPLKVAASPSSSVSQEGEGALPLTKAPTAATPGAPKETPPGEVSQAGGSGAVTTNLTGRSQGKNRSVGEPSTHSLLQFVAANGGLKPHPELQAIGLSYGNRTHLPDEKGFFGVLKAEGDSLDRMREKAEEAGYLRGTHAGTSSIRDLLDALDNELRGAKSAPEGQERPSNRSQKRLAAEREQFEKDRDEADYGDARREIMAEYPKTPPDLLEVTARMMVHEGVDLDNAIEAAAVRMAAEDLHTGETEDSILDTFGPEAADAIHAAAAYDTGETAARESQERAEPGSEGEAGGAGGRVPETGAEGEPKERTAEIAAGDSDETVTVRLTRDGPWDFNDTFPEIVRAGFELPTSEKGADSKEQFVIPGAEKIGQGEQAQRRANQPLKPKANQKGMDIGLFGTERDQADLLDTIANALKKDADKVDPKDVQTAAEIMAQEPGTDPATAFGRAVVENVVKEELLTEKEAVEAYGPQAKDVVESGRKRTSRRRKPVEPQGAAPDQVGAGPGEAGKLPRRRKARQGEGERAPAVPEREASTPSGKPAEGVQGAVEPATGRRQPARNEARNATQDQRAANSEAALTDRIKTAYDAIKGRQMGISGAMIGDLAQEAGASVKEIHDWLLPRVKAGKATIHPSTSVDIPQRDKDAAIRIPGHEPLALAVLKPSAFEAEKPKRDEFDDIFDQAVNEQFAKPATLDDVAKGLGTIFGKKPKSLGEPEPAFSDDTYRQALPYFKAGVAHFTGAGDLANMVRSLISHLAGAGMDADAIRSMKPYIRRFIDDVRAGKEALNAPSRGEILERDRQDREATNGVGSTDVSTAAEPAGRGAGERGEASGEGERPAGGERLPQDYAPVVGARGHLELPERPPDIDDRDAADRGNERSAPDREEGFSFDNRAADEAATDAQRDSELNQRRQAQQRANRKNIPFKAARIDNIRDSLPMLLPEQQHDVQTAELRFMKTEGHGMLFTNGTGTGKTYTGLGIIKRFFQQGKSNVLVIAPSQGILLDWQRSARDLGLEMHILESITDAGKSFSGTTYANAGENRHLADREWDLVVPDEAHKLSSDQSGTVTDALRTVRALTLHPEGLRTRAEHKLRADVDRINALPELARGAEWQKLHPKIQAMMEPWKEQARPKGLFLSATPFAYHFSLDWAQGYLFDYPPDTNTGAYNAPTGRDRFYMEHLGYRKRTGKLTKPDAEVRQEIMERGLHEYLKKQGSLAGRMLTVDKDYDRKFVLAHNAIGTQIDQALNFLQENEQFRPLLDFVNTKFDYLTRMRFLEAIKAESSIDFINQSLALGRKVVVFHDYNEGGGINPFDLNFTPNAKFTKYENGKAIDVALGPLYEQFLAQNPYVRDLKFADYKAPIATLTGAFPHALVYNGTVSKKARDDAKRLFNQDDSGRNLIIVQSAAGEVGISLHDTTGVHQRVLLNLGMPIRPTSAIQQEGRIYRVGQASNAIMRYMNTGTDWERWTFAGKIAERAGTAENLALGNQARAMRQSFVDAFSNAGDYQPTEGEGTGGKELDRPISHDMSEFQKAKTHYFAQAKVAGRRDQREGQDYFATPEPIGLKMVEWANARSGEKMLEPSAGHGAIARYLPEDTHRTLVEPSSSLASRAALTSPGARVIADRFENLDVPANKFDAIVMNPPFGRSGKTAMEHLLKAAKHLKNGGRIVALIPAGANIAKGVTDPNLRLVGHIFLPTVTFERSGTAIRTEILVLEKQTDPEVAKKLDAVRRDYSHIETIGELFDAIEHSEVLPRLEPTTKDIEAPAYGRITVSGIEFNLPPIPIDGETFADLKSKVGRDQFAKLAKMAEANGGQWLRGMGSFRFPNLEARSKFLDAVANPPPETTSSGVKGVTFTNGETKHSRTGKDLFVATPDQRVSRVDYDQMKAAAETEGGYWSMFRSSGAIPGFQFPTKEARDRFLARMRGEEQQPGFGENAQMQVLDRGRNSNVEHLVGIGPNGERFEGSGTRSNVETSGELEKALRTPGSDIVIHHNHPSSRSFSALDISTMALPGAHTLWAHGHNGNVYRMRYTKAAMDALEAMGDGEKRRTFTYNLFHKIENRLFNPLNEENKKRPGGVIAEAGNASIHHLLMKVLQNAGIVDYETNFEPPPVLDTVPGLSKAMEAATLAAKKEFFNGEPAPDTDARRADALRHPGNLGTTFDRGAIARRVGPQTGLGEARGADDPEEESRTAAREQRDVVLGALGDPSKVIKEFKGFWTSTFQPEMVSDRALMADPLFARYKAAQAQEKDSIIRASESEWNYWNKKGEAARLDFLRRFERARYGVTFANPTETAMARRYRAILDTNWAEEQRWGSTASFVEDYMAHIWERPQEWRDFSKRMSDQVGPTWFQKKRTIDYIDEGLAHGLKLRYTNPVDIIVHRLLSGVDMRMRMQLLYALKDEALAWNTTQGQDHLLARGWQLIVAPDRKQWVLHPDVQLLWKNAVEAKGLWQDEHVGGSIFRGWMAFKNAWVPAKLAVSAFHPLHVQHINYAQGMARGWDLLTKNHEPLEALKAVADGIMRPTLSAPGFSGGAVAGAVLGSFVGMPIWGGLAGGIAGAAAYGGLQRTGVVRRAKTIGSEAREAWTTRPNRMTPAQKAVVQLMTDGGFVPQLSEQLKLQAIKQFKVSFQKALRREAGPMDVWKMVSSGAVSPIQVMQKPIFERWIPELKTAAYLQQASDLLRRRPELWTNHNDRRLALRAIAKSIDNRFGEMFYGNLFWNRYVKDTGIASFLSLGWNLGFVREFFGAAFEAVSRPLGLIPPLKPGEPRKQIRKATNKIPFVIAYVTTAALINGIMTYLYSGQPPQGLDWIFARIGGENPDGSPRRVTNMFYLREVPMLLKHIQERGGNVLSGTGEMIWNKLMFEPFSELANNRDYYGYNIWDENAPIYKQFGQAMRHMWGDQSPMSLSGAQNAARLSGHEFPGPKETLEHPDRLTAALQAKGVDLSILGFGPAPAYVEKSPMANRIGYLYREHVAPVSRPNADEETSKEKMAVRTAIMIAKRDKDQDMMSLAREKGKELGLTPKYMNDIGKVPTDVLLFSRLPDADQLSLLRNASQEDRDRYFHHAHLKVRRQLNQGAEQGASP